MATIRFFQVRLPIPDVTLPEAHNGVRPIGVTGRYLFSPDLPWHYCSAEKLITLELLDVAFEVPADGDEDMEHWQEAEEELFFELVRDSSGCQNLDIARRNVGQLKNWEDPTSEWIFAEKYSVAVSSSDEDSTDDEGDEVPDHKLWDDAREYAQGNWRV